MSGGGLERSQAGGKSGTDLHQGVAAGCLDDLALIVLPSGGSRGRAGGRCGIGTSSAELHALNCSLIKVFVVVCGRKKQESVSEKSCK